jgi:hypothetical protein
MQLRNIISGLFFGLLVFSGCENKESQETGVLEGTISIGPICPVETDPPEPGCLPTAETYKAYPVYIYTADGSQKIKLISPGSDGSFSVELAADSYLIVLEKENNGIGSGNLPLEVTIKPSETTTIDIDIDTGIR